MKQVFFSFKDKVESYPLNERTVGIFKVGRYRGYVRASKVSAGLYDIHHSLGPTSTNSDSVIEDDSDWESVIHKKLNTEGKVNKDKELITNFGVTVMPTGVVIHDTDTIRVNINQNSLGGTRYDLLVISHEYLEVSGGMSPTYEIVTGTTVDTLPLLPALDKKVALGVFRVPAGDINSVNVTYKPFAAPFLGDQEIDMLRETIIQSINIEDATLTTKGIIQLAGTDDMNNGENAEKAVTPLMFSTTTASTSRTGTVRKSSNANLNNSTGDTTVPDLRWLKDNNAKLNNQVVRVTSSSFTIGAEHNGKILYGALTSNSGFANINLTIPAGLGDNFHVGLVHGTSNFTVIPDGGITIIKKDTKDFKLNTKGSSALLNTMGSATEWLLTGDLKNL